MVHRLVFSAFNGPIPAGSVVAHINDIKEDCRIANLILASHSENYVMSVVNGKRINKLTAKQVDEIKFLAANGISRKKIAEIYNVHVAYLNMIVRGARRNKTVIRPEIANALAEINVTVPQ